MKIINPRAPRRSWKRFFSLLNLALVFLFILTTGFGCKGVSDDVKPYVKPITLKYWRVWDDSDAFDQIIKDYRAIHPNINIEYRKLRPEEYEQALLEAFAEDRGPDILSIHESWLLKYQPKLVPMPAQITMAYQTIKGTIKKEVVQELRTSKTMTIRDMRDNFADVVNQNAVIKNQIYGLPLSLETLVMFYNRDLMKKSGIINPPLTWKEFQEDAQKMTRLDNRGNILQSGAAIGTGANINNSADILSLLMMQNGTIMTDVSGRPTFFTPISAERNPGAEALSFYTDFTSPVKAVYSWNSSLGNALDVFMSGRVGIIFGYNYDLPAIRAGAPRLDIGIAPVPQVDPQSSVNYANYWLETVSNKSKNQNAAWDFILFAAKKDEVQKYLNKTKRPAALKALIESQKEQDDLVAAAGQILTASNWYRGLNAPVVTAALKSMIDQLANATTDQERRSIMGLTIQTINQTIQ